MKYQKATKIVLIIIFFIIVTTYFGIVGFSRAQFDLPYDEGDGPTGLESVTGVLGLYYTGGISVELDNIIPGQSISKEISVENTGTMETGYSINWDALVNTFINNEIVVRATCVQTHEGIVTGTCEDIYDVPVSNSLPSPIKEDIPIASGYTHTYSITIEFIETGSSQDYNQDKEFSGKIEISEGNIGYVAAIENSYYETLTDAISNVPLNNVSTNIRLISLVEEDVVISNNQNVNLNLNNHDITGSIINDGTLVVSGMGKINNNIEDVALLDKPSVVNLNNLNNNYKVKKLTTTQTSLIENNGILTINGAIINDEINTNVIENNGTLTLGNDVSIKAKGIIVKNNSSTTTTINGGNYETTLGTKMYDVVSGSTLNISGGEHKNTTIEGGSLTENHGNLNISGGKYSNSSSNVVLLPNYGILNIANQSEFDSTATIIENHSNSDVTIENGIFKSYFKEIAIINMDSTSEMTITGGTFSSDYFVGTTLISNQGTMTISNGTYSNLGTTNPLLVNNKELTISGSPSFTSSYVVIKSMGNSISEITGGTYIAKGINAILWSLADSTMNVSGGTFQNTNSIGGGLVSCNGECDLSGGEFENAGAGYYAISAYGTVTTSSDFSVTTPGYTFSVPSGGTLNVQGGTLTNSGVSPIATVNAGGTFNMSGGNAYSTSTTGGALVSCIGECNLSNGTYRNYGTSKYGIQTSGEVNVSSNFSVTSPGYPFAVYNSATLNIEGGTITNTGTSSHVTVYAGGTFNMTNGTLNSTNASGGSFASCAGECNLSGGSFSNRGAGYYGIVASGVVTTSSNFSMTTGGYTFSVPSAGTLNIQGGTISNSGTSAIATVNSGGTFNMSSGQVNSTSASGGSLAKCTGTCNLSGGNYTNVGNAYKGVTVSATTTISSNFSITTPGTALYATSTGIINFQNGTITNSGLLETVLVDAGGEFNMSGGTISGTNAAGGTLAKCDGICNLSGGSYTNLGNNGYAIIVAGAATLSSTFSMNIASTAMQVTSIGFATINGGTYTTSASSPIIKSESGNFNMGGGTFSSTNTNGGTLINCDGTCNLYGGSFTNNGSNYYAVASSGLLSMSGDVSITSSVIPINVSGGIFYFYSGTITNTGTTALVNIGTYGKFYMNSGDLISNSSLTTEVIKNNGTFIMNGGRIISISANGCALLNNKTATITAGEMSNRSTSYAAITTYGTLNISGTANVNSTAQPVANMGTLTISGGTVTSSGVGGAFANYAGGTANVYGGTLSSTGSAGEIIYNLGSLNVTGGTYTATQPITMIYGNNSVINITDATIVYNGLVIRAAGTSRITITDSSVTSTNSTYGVIHLEGDTQMNSIRSTIQNTGGGITMIVVGNASYTSTN